MVSARVVALLVGIDAYVAPVSALYGCRNDIAALERYLTARVGNDLDLRTLYDADATRAAVIGAFRDHLCTAGPDDVVLFAYAGHGSEEPAPPAVAHLEPTGRIQTLVLHDCGRRIGGKLQRSLADKELALLIAEVAATGAHVVVILDCCNSGGGTRDPFVRVRSWRPDPDSASTEQRDLVRQLDGPRPSEEFLPGTMQAWTAPAAPHVALSACRSHETAKEYRAGAVTRGAFSVALNDTLDLLGTRTTYRSLLATVGSRVERTAEDQHPELFPSDVGGAADGLFLDGTVAPVAASFTVSRGFHGWEVDAGSVHGLRSAEGDEAFVLACQAPDGTAAGLVRVTAVDIARSAVEPLGWEPADLAYDAVVADVPLPPAEVTFDLPLGAVAPDDIAAVRDAVTAALATSGPGDRPSPYVRVATGSTPQSAGAEPLRLRIGVPSPGVARLARADGSPVTTDTDVADVAGARLAVARLEHVARWEQVRDLGDHASPLREAVVLGVYDATDGAAGRAALPADGGGFHLRYRRGSGGEWIAPRVFMDVRNVTDDALYVAVLDLTDRYRCHPVLTTVRLAGGHTLALWDGTPIPVELPAGRAIATGARVRDWLKVIVSDVDFDASAFDLPALDDARSASRRAAPTARNTLERLAAKAARRDIGSDAAAPVARWAATTVSIDTVVPADPG